MLLDSLNRNVLTACRNAAHQTLQDASGTDFGEFRSSVGKHRLDALGPAHGARKLEEEVVFYASRLGLALSGYVLVHGAEGPVDFGAGNGFRELLAGRLHKRGVECSAHGQGQGALRTCGLESCAGFFDGLLFSGDYHLSVGVVVGCDHDARGPGANRFNSIGVQRDDGGHCARLHLAAALHSAGPGGDKPMYWGFYQPEFGYDLNTADLAGYGVGEGLDSYLIVSKTAENEQLVEDINAALKEVVEEGTSKELNVKYFGDDYSPSYN